MTNLAKLNVCEYKRTWLKIGLQRNAALVITITECAWVRKLSVSQCHVTHTRPHTHIYTHTHIHIHTHIHTQHTRAHIHKLRPFH